MKKTVGAPSKYAIQTERFDKKIPSDIKPHFEAILNLRALKKRMLTKDELIGIFKKDE